MLIVLCQNSRVILVLLKELPGLETAIIRSGTLCKAPGQISHGLLRVWFGEKKGDLSWDQSSGLFPRGKIQRCVILVEEGCTFCDWKASNRSSERGPRRPRFWRPPPSLPPSSTAATLTEVAFPPSFDATPPPETWPGHRRPPPRPTALRLAAHPPTFDSSSHNLPF